MTKTELKGLHQQLLKMGRRIRGQVAEVSGEALRQSGGDSAGNLSHVPNHPADLSSDAYDQEVALGLLENEELMLEQIVQALDRVEQGTYGRCVECDQPIALERLQALPYASCCIQCARIVESQGPSRVE